jgi:hypothetical protein
VMFYVLNLQHSLQCHKKLQGKGVNCHFGKLNCLRMISHVSKEASSAPAVSPGKQTRSSVNK